MKTIVLANQKGGVGKSAVAVQLAYFLALMLGKRVLFIDFDHQRNSSKPLRVGGYATVSKYHSSKILTGQLMDLEMSKLLLISADNRELLSLEKEGAKHNFFATNLHSFLNRVDEDFDFCVIDTNPNPDIRQLASLAVCDFVLSPIQLNQEAIDGIGDLLNHERVGIRKIKATINPKLEFIGILPNIVEPTPFQRDNFRDLSLQYAKLLIPITNGFAAIKKTTAVPESQALGVPIWKFPKTSGRDAWAQLKPIFEKITSVMEA